MQNRLIYSQLLLKCVIQLNEMAGIFKTKPDSLPGLPSLLQHEKEDIERLLSKKGPAPQKRQFSFSNFHEEPILAEVMPPSLLDMLILIRTNEPQKFE